MSDSSLRELERAYAADKSDENILRDLEAARLRAGLGWHGERLPEFRTDRHWFGPHAKERGVYTLITREGNKADGETAARIQLVYVPGGEVECDRPGCAQMLRQERFDGYSMRRNHCPRCKDSGKFTLAPFYLGRFPVTWREFDAYCLALKGPNRDYWPAKPDGATEHHPAVNLDLAESLAFCAWAGLRLPSEMEWRWAALGAATEDTCSSCMGRGQLAEPTCGLPNQCLTASHSDCQRCGNTGKVPGAPRAFPWGNELPSDERCVFAGSLVPWERAGGPLQCAHGYARGIRCPDCASAKPVVDCEACVLGTCYGPLNHNGTCADGTPGLSTDPLVPARPKGASWCGAHDLCGNVWERVAEPDRLCGGSFNSTAETLARSILQPISSAAQNAVGFRVALSARAS